MPVSIQQPNNQNVRSLPCRYSHPEQEMSSRWLHYLTYHIPQTMWWNPSTKRRYTVSRQPNQQVVAHYMNPENGRPVKRTLTPQDFTPCPAHRASAGDALCIIPKSMTPESLQEHPESVRSIQLLRCVRPSSSHALMVQVNDTSGKTTLVPAHHVIENVVRDGAYHILMLPVENNRYTTDPSRYVNRIVA